VDPEAPPLGAVEEGRLFWSGREAFGEQASLLVASRQFDKLVSPFPFLVHLPCPSIPPPRRVRGETAMN